jgi:glycosyltransferase involved in cell wall biosynthesis
MRLLTVVHGPVFGGAQNQTIQLARPLAEHGWETIAMVPAEPGTGRTRLEQAGIETIAIPLHRLRATIDPRVQLTFGATLPGEIRAIRRIIRERGIDLVQAHGPTNPHSAIAAHREGVAVNWQIYDTVTPVPLRRVLMPMVVRIADVITTWGTELARVHPPALSLGERAIPVFPPVDASRFRPDPDKRAAARAELGIGDGDIAIGTVGNRNPTKGHEWLVRATGALIGRHPNLRVRILGAASPPHASYEASVRAEAESLGLLDGEKLTFIDPGTRVPDLLPAFDVFVISSVPRSEGIPTVIFEAMSTGLPVVTTRVGAVHEVIEDGFNGWVVPSEDTPALTAGIEPLLRDPELRARIGRQSRERVLERYDIDRCADVHLRAFELALEHRRARNN